MSRCQAHFLRVSFDLMIRAWQLDVIQPFDQVPPVNKYRYVYTV